MYLIGSNKVYTNLVKKLFSSTSVIPSILIGYEVFIYSGLRWLLRTLSRWSVGYKLGTLTWNRKIALYKLKLLKKKK